MSHDECFLLLSPDGQQDLVTHLAHPTLVIDVDASGRPMVWGVAQGAVVHYTDPSHLLDCTEAPTGANGREKSVCDRDLSGPLRGQEGACQLHAYPHMHTRSRLTHNVTS